MKTTVIISLTILLGLALGCNKDKKDKPDAPMGADPMAAPMQGDTPAAPKPGDPPKADATVFEAYAPLAKLIEATKACTTPVFGDCAERKALEDWVSSVFMNKVELTREQKIAAFKTAASLVVHENEMVRNHAAAVFQTDPFGLNEAIAQDPKLVDKKFIENLITSLPKLDSFRSGWLMSNIPSFAPAYGLLDACFKAADGCKEKDDLYNRLLSGFPKYSRLKHFDVTQKYAADTSEKALPLASAALSGLLQFTWEKDEAVKICTWLPAALPATVDATVGKRLVDSYHLYRFLDVVDRCKVLTEKDHLAILEKLDEALKKLKELKLDSEDYSKMYKDQVEHFTKTITELKK